MKRLWYYYLYLFLAWASFRYFIRLPEIIEELWFKPLLWVTPLFWWNLALKEKVGMFGKKWIETIALGLVVGLSYFLILRNKSMGSFHFDRDMVGVALATAITEELVFSGFVAGYLERLQKGRLLSLLVVGLMAMMIRLPILFFVYKTSAVEVVGVLLVALTSGVINAWIRVRSGNVTGSVLARWLMNLAALG